MLLLLLCKVMREKKKEDEKEEIASPELWQQNFDNAALDTSVHRG
jgi:hypothetical protein